MKEALELFQISFMALLWFCYIWAADRFCKKFLRIHKKNEILWIIILGAGKLLLEIGAVRLQISHIIFALAGHGIVIGAVLLLFQENTAKKAAVVIAMETAVKLAGNLCTSLFSCLVLVWKHRAWNVSIPVWNEWEMCLNAGIGLVSMILFLWWISGYLLPVFSDKPDKWYLILTMPLAAVLGVVDIAEWGATKGILIRSGGTMSLYYDEIFSHTEMIVLTALSLALSGCYVFGMNCIYLEQRKSGRYHMQIAAYKMLEEQYSQSEKLRHDMKNHIIALQGLLEEREWEKMKIYLERMENSGNLESGQEVTGSRAVDALLCQKRKSARENQTAWECDVQIPKNCEINEFDFCVLFGNILDNALEACRKMEEGAEKFIHIQGRMVKNCYLLEGKNSMDKKSAGREEIKDSGKAERQGLGLSNISDTVRRYHGTMHVEMKENVFVITILLPFCEAVHDMKQVV